LDPTIRLTFITPILEFCDCKEARRTMALHIENAFQAFCMFADSPVRTNKHVLVTLPPSDFDLEQELGWNELSDYLLEASYHHKDGVYNDERVIEYWKVSGNAAFD
jgi:hypothetical protein